MSMIVLILLRQAAAGVGEAAEGHQLPDRELHLDVVALGQDRQPLGQLLALPLDDVLAVEVHQAAVPGDQPGDDAHDRGFARAVGADHGDDLAFGDVKGDVVHHGLAVVLFR